MKLNPALFWDVDYETLDWVKYAHWVIVRVFERGDVDDIRQVRRHYGDDLVKEALLNAIPLKKFADPMDIANAVAFFAAPESAYVTGQVISVSGGLTMVG
jgi:NAD(P)-dependent dehydrogenase (short-subunit alcohol dehydrogenase family)